MDNRKYLYRIRTVALSSSYWSHHISGYYTHSVYYYGPMIKDDLYKSMFTDGRVVGVIEMESRLGRPLKVEELQVCPLSVAHFILGNLTITGSDDERQTLDELNALIEDRINRYESKSVVRKIKVLREWLNRYYGDNYDD